MVVVWLSASPCEAITSLYDRGAAEDGGSVSALCKVAILTVGALALPRACRDNAVKSSQVAGQIREPVVYVCFKPRGFGQSPSAKPDSASLAGRITGSR